MRKQKIKNINVDIDNIDYIIHSADIHIRLFQRHDEYREVFKRLYDKLEKNKKNSVFFIVGDLIHSKTEMSPELVDLLSEFLEKCADILPTFIITGNHDCNLTNRDRMDSIFPIIKNKKHKNLFYLKDSGIYKIKNVHFVVMSIFNDPEDYIKASEFDGERKIAITHNIINNSIGVNGYSLSNDKLNIDFFKGYDIVLLGDIHKKQILSNYQEIKIDEDKLEDYLKKGWVIEKD